MIPKRDLLFKEIREKTNCAEGEPVIARVLIEVFWREGIATKALARQLQLPIPLVTALKKELIKAGVLRQDRGVRLTPVGRRLVEEELGYEGIDGALYQEYLQSDAQQVAEKLENELTEILAQRPGVDVTLDQCKATPATSLKRAFYALQKQYSIGQKLLCIGDDDLVSVAVGLLWQQLFHGRIPSPHEIHVVDLDQRFLNYIAKVAAAAKLPIVCHHHDLRQPLPPEWRGRFDGFFTDPPDTLPGLNLFLSRGLSGLKAGVGRPIFFSFAHKPPDFTLEMQQQFWAMGLVIKELIPRFNEYEGAEIIGNTGQLILLETTPQTRVLINDSFADSLYTGDFKNTVRFYECKSCRNLTAVGQKEDFETIEKLKKQGCPVCSGQVFDLVSKQIKK